MVRPLLVILTCIFVLGACTQRMVCPAYQSAFIYDKEALRKKFSYFQEDSTPKVFTASKNKYLVAEPVSYRKKIRTMQTVAMKDVYVHVPDSLKVGLDALNMDDDGVVPGAELDLAARSVIDSTYIVDVPKDTTQSAEDSVYVITKDKELKFLKYDRPDSARLDPASGKYVAKTPSYKVAELRYNVDQDNYMWYLRDYLVLPDVKLARNKPKEEGEGSSGKDKKGERRGIKGFLKNLFKKKKDNALDSAEVEIPGKNKDEFDYIEEEESDSTATPSQNISNRDRKKQKATKVKPPKTPKKKKEKKQKQDANKEEETPKKEDEDDGF